MKILIDMNLSPDWADVLRRAGHEAIHWSSVGSFRAPDPEVLRYARDHSCVLFTHDLGISAQLALTRETGPSILQIRTHDVLPVAVGALVLAVLSAHAATLEKGALISVDEATARVRILPIK